LKNYQNKFTNFGTFLAKNLANSDPPSKKFHNQTDAIEGARIDQGHHNNWANRALEETLEFDDTIEQTLNWINNLDETLVIVTADHSHTMSLSGYADRGADIRGLGRENAEDGLPYALLSYASGPSFYQHYRSMFL
jgi:alkaline phosphatase